MPEFQINWIAVLVAGVVRWVIGALWYSPVLFAKVWMQSAGKTEEQCQEEFHPMKLVVAFIGGLVTATVMAIFISVADVTTIQMGALLGLLGAVGFASCSSGVNNMMEGRPRKLTFITSGHDIVGIVAIGAILGAWV